MKINLSPRGTLGIAFLGLIALYTVFQARFLILGPQIRLTSPEDGAVVSSPLVLVRGTATNASFISLDDRPIFLDQKGAFEEKLLVPPRQSTIMIRARDRFGRETEKTTSIVLIQ